MKRVKLDDKNKKFSLVDYNQNLEGYKPNNEKIVISRDVVFDEEVEWDLGAHKTINTYSFLYLKMSRKLKKFNKFLAH